jgi:hypothetical protein
MRAKLKGIGSADALWDSGADPSGSFCVSIWVLAGPADGPGEESFDLLVCNPAYLSNELKKRGVISGRDYLFVDHIDRPMIEGYLRRRIEDIEGNTWIDVAERIGRIGHWEFEDYKPAI